MEIAPADPTPTIMIIRAVSSGSSDDDDDDTGHDHGNTPLRFHATSPSSHRNVMSLSASAFVKLAWLAVSLSCITLLMVDLSAVLNHFFPVPNAIDSRRNGDPFSLAAWVLLLSRGRSGPLSACFANNLAGQLFVCAWIYSRESSLATQRRREIDRKQQQQRATTNKWLVFCMVSIRTSPWPAICAVLWLGHLGSCLYILFALFESHDDGNINTIRTKFWLGKANSSSSVRSIPRV